MNEFEAHLRSLGLQPGAIAPDGKVRRCPTDAHPRKKNGAYWLSSDGRHGWGQDWTVHDEQVPWRAGKDTPLPKFDPGRMRRELEESKRRRRKAVLGVREFWQQCKPLRWGHAYLKDHGLGMDGATGLRVDRKGWLVVPGNRRGKLLTVQRIAPDGAKRFWKGAPAKGVSYLIERPAAAVTILCEGVATGLALFAAVPLARVLVAFHTANLTELDVLRRIPKGVVVVASDNDHKTVCQMHKEEGRSVPLDPREGLPEGCRCNPGIIAALKASEVLHCGIAVPEGMAGTDWCDLRLERFKQRMAMKDEFDTTATLLRTVDAEIRMAVMRQSKLRVTHHGG